MNRFEELRLMRALLSPLSIRFGPPRGRIAVSIFRAAFQAPNVAARAKHRHLTLPAVRAVLLGRSR